MRSFDKLRMTVLLGSAFALTACTSAITSEKISQIHAAMKPDEVKALLGPPARIDQAETTGLRGEVYHYPTPNGEGRVVFLNDAVFNTVYESKTAAGGFKITSGPQKP